MLTPDVHTLSYTDYARLRGAATPTPGTVVIEPPAAIRRPPPFARLVCVHPIGELLGRLFELRGVPAHVGREDGCDLLVPHPSVSRAHARLIPRPDGLYEVTDLDSSNGTSVNGEQVLSRALRNGDRVQFGGAIFLYLTGDAE